jgi:hypothetical protein
LYCTLTERVGQEIWPIKYFSVQVKSDPSPWEFPNPESVKWLVQHPLPLFLCVVNKKDASFQIYHTCPRFYAWTIPPPPTKLELIPGTAGPGKSVQWKGGTSYSLSAPILAFSISELHDDVFREEVKKVLKFWIEFEERNLKRVKSGIHEFSMPHEYETNAINSSLITHCVGDPSPEATKRAILSLEVQLSFVAYALWTNGDFAGAVRAALLHRYFFRDGDDFERSVEHFNIWLSNNLGKKDYIFQAIDELGANLDAKLKKVATIHPPTSASSLARLSKEYKLRSDP